MKNSYTDFTDFLRDFKSEPVRNNTDCLNGDFCVLTPKNRNDGILTMAFVDMQPLESVYSMSDAFCRGTLFPNLDKPFYGGRMK